MSAEEEIQVARTAEVHILHDGYARSPHVASTVSFVRDGAALVVIDPGMVAAPSAILDPLAALGVAPAAITDVIFSHHHPDHTLHAALFPNARFHDHWAIYQGDLWQSRAAEGFLVSPSIRLIETPGHSPQDITTLVGTPTEIVAFTHLWWTAKGPPEDPRGTDMAAIHAGRERVLQLATRIVPGHGPAFIPDENTPR